MRYVTSRPGKAGEVRWYWQRKGYRIERLPADEVARHQAAMALNEAADRGELPQKPVLIDASSLDLVAGIIADYRAHRSYASLADGTKKSYEPVLADLREMWGGKRVAAIDQSLCVDYLESIPKLNERRKTRAVLRCVLKRAVYHRKLPSNPTDGIELESPTPRERYLQEAEIVKFIEACRAHKTHGRMVYNGFMLLLFTVQRPGDMLKMGRSQYTGGVIRLRQQKTSKWVEVPAHEQLRPLLDGLVAANDALLFMTHDGKPVSEKTFNYRFNEVKRAAGLDDIQARDLRRTATIRMAEAGADIQDIAACGGWSIEYTKKILETYMPRTLKMAERGVARMPNISLTF